MLKVAIIQKTVPHYRVRFFEDVCAQASAAGLEVAVYCGDTGAQNARYDFPHVSLPTYPLTRNENGVVWIKGLTAALAGADIIVAQEGLQCLNIPLLWAIRQRLCKRWIWLGHGYNFQASSRPYVPTRIKEAIKHFMTKRSAGIITYTWKGAEYWVREGLPAARVIPFFNTIDVEGVRQAQADISAQRRSEVKQRLSLEGKQVLLFSGRLYPEKQVAFLLRAFAILRNANQHVALLIIGDGVERKKLESLAAHLGLKDVHFLGEIVDSAAIAPYFSLADLMVIPGLVGLAIVHGFACGIPMITTRHDYHSPEIEYLSSDNGMITSFDETAYSRTIASVLADQCRLAQMRRAATHTADQLLLHLSVQRFVQAIRSISDSY